MFRIWNGVGGTRPETNPIDVPVCYSASDLSNIEFQIHGKDNPVPDGWRIATVDEGRQFASSLFGVLEYWGSYGFADGKVDFMGSGFPNVFTDGPHLGCGYIYGVVIIPDDGCGLTTLDWSC